MARDDQAERLGRAIASRRAALGMKRKDLALAAGLSYPYIAELENGTKSPSARALSALSDALELSPAALLAQSDTLPASAVAESASSLGLSKSDQAWSEWPRSLRGDEDVAAISAVVIDRVLHDVRRQLERDVPQIVRDVLAQSRWSQT